MKKFMLFLVVFVVISNVTIAQEVKKEAKKVITKTEAKVEEAVSTGGPIMTLESDKLDYGTIEKNSEPYRSIKFTNTGNEPLIIKSARGNCGCTVPTWPREAIMPGETKELKVRYATNRVGKINKRVTLVTNEKTNNKHIVRVIGKVLQPESTQGVPERKKSMLNMKK